jgi:hypothetical protein
MDASPQDRERAPEEAEEGRMTGTLGFTLLDRRSTL